MIHRIREAHVSPKNSVNNLQVKIFFEKAGIGLGMFLLPASLRTRENSLFLHALTSHKCSMLRHCLCIHSRIHHGWGGVGVGGGRNCMS